LLSARKLTIKSALTGMHFTPGNAKGANRVQLSIPSPKEGAMRTPASIAGHPIHPMLVPIAIGCFIFSFASDVLCVVTGNTQLWNILAYYTMIGGVLGALAAAVPGLIDLLSLPAGPIKKTALTHMGINLTVVAIYVVNIWMRRNDPSNLKVPMILSAVTIVMLVFSGWLGGKMVYEAGVGVSGPGDTTT
jgi:uncharacterized membrane protein